MRISLTFLVATIASVAAFVTPSVVVQPRNAFVSSTASRTVSLFAQNHKIHDDDSDIDFVKLASTTSAVWLSSAAAAVADSPDWGIFEGRTGSLLHPVTMASLLLFSLYTGFLGWQWRRQRSLGDEISSLKKSLPVPNVKEAIEEASKEDGDASKLPELKAALAMEEKINDLTAERKELASQGLRDKHYSQGALLAFVGTAFAIEGPLNTYARAGKLFPGPHLYAGAGLVVLWAAAAACVPSMQKGNDTARSIHIGANAIGIGLFGWQVVSGIPILLKVIEKTQWP